MCISWLLPIMLLSMHGSTMKLVFLYSGRLPEDGSPVSKHVGVGSYHEWYFVIVFYSPLLTALFG